VDSLEDFEQMKTEITPVTQYNIQQNALRLVPTFYVGTSAF